MLWLNLLVQLPLVIGTAGLWAQAKKRRVAPALGCLSEVAWAGWAVYAHVWSLVPWCFLWAGLYTRTWWKWRV